jgi:hypothetical protein
MNRIKNQFIFFFLLVNTAVGQVSPKNTASPDAVILRDAKHFKHFALLLKDTSDQYNRVADCCIKHDSTSMGPACYCPAIIIDSGTCMEVERYLRAEFAAGHFTKKIYKYVRLYIGYFNTEQDSTILIQFLTLKQFNRHKLYSGHVDLLARVKKDKDYLRFALFTKKNGHIAFVNSFPIDFFGQIN